MVQKFTKFSSLATFFFFFCATVSSTVDHWNKYFVVDGGCWIVTQIALFLSKYLWNY